MGPVTAGADDGGVTCRVPNRTTSRLALLVALGVAAFFCGAAPALADNGPHVAGAGVLADSCAGCHRVHTAKSAELTLDPQPKLCYTCHGKDGTGADTDVEDGVGRGGVSGALRGGGFAYALIDAANVTVNNDDHLGRNTGGIVGVLDEANPQAVTSSHSVDGSDATAWGNGVANATASAGNTVQLRCGSCHDPHGNGNYRILRPIPLQSGADSTPIAVPETPGAAKVYTTTNYWAAWDDKEPNFIKNVSMWCSTCHTRYLADSQGGGTNSNDAVFAYRHWSDATQFGRPNCIQCHVAHGSNAKVAQPAPTPHPTAPDARISGTVAHPDERTGLQLEAPALPVGDSRLLRIQDRGTCGMCHSQRL
jgi:predicted CXXCH cytochrome family protein